MSRNFGDPTQYQLESITIDGEDMRALFVSISLYENIYIPVVTGEIMLMETDGSEFMEKHGNQSAEKRLEYTEDIEFVISNAVGDRLEFQGVLNGIKNESTKDSKRLYLVEFSSETARTNESTFVTKRFKEASPEDVVNEMLTQKIGAENVSLNGTGIPMNFLGSRRKPFDIIKYVCTHGVTQNSKASDNKQSKKETITGTTGFLCWETTIGYRFASLDQLKKGEVGKQHQNYEKTLAQRGAGIEQTMRQVIDVNFPKLGNMQDKQRAGAFNHISVLFDMDKGYYKEYAYETDEETSTPKQRKINKKPTRYMMKVTSNERHNLECERSQPDKGDQSRRFLGQNNVSQNTFDDQFGEFTLAPSFSMHAGDSIEFKISKVKSEKEGGYDEKHSGMYVIKGVAHHIYATGSAYTRLSTIRSTTQQNDTTSKAQ